MKPGTTLASTNWRRAALLLVACALLLRIPAGWMPVAHAQGVTLSWCSGVSHSVPAEAEALLAAALGDKAAPKHKPAPDLPCAFAAAAQPMAAADPLPAILAPEMAEPAAFAARALIPGRGLAAPPPRSTGPPLLA
ncbi:hypothetical protein AB2M62_07240 [Sphingomonas sp. MMS12-HWE2-04]|uniref:hypothetical protein n=1 Tax=Sphingomonas sp. MMS12-HWE2-04 TaxID=3234199 RepID=UPI00384BB23E